MQRRNASTEDQYTAFQTQPEKEVEISINEDRLQAFGLTIDQINTAVLRQNINLTGGKIEVNNTKYFFLQNIEFEYNRNTLKTLDRIIIVYDNYRKILHF